MDKKTYHREYSKRHYAKNRQRYLDRAKARNLEVQKRFREFIDKLKSDSPCSDCGKKFNPWQMDFDHIGIKNFEIARMVYHSLNSVKREVEKCEIVCANCHRNRTHNRK